MKSITKTTVQFICLIMFITSCDFNDNLIEYDEKLVVFASINAGFPVTDTVFVSRTAAVSESVDAQDLYVDDAEVKLINLGNGSELRMYSLGNGRYHPIDLSLPNIDSVVSIWTDFIITSGMTYRIVVSHDGDSVIAQTTVPDQIEIIAE